MSDPAAVLRQRFFSANGAPLAGGKLYSYVAGSSTPVATYIDSSGSTPNQNPIILDANGYCDLYLTNGSYKFVLTDSSDVTQWTVDNFVDNGSVSVSSTWVKHAVTDGQAATNLVGQTVDISLYSSAIYDCEIIRGTTVINSGVFYIQNLNGTGRVEMGLFVAEEAHGVTFSVSQASTIVQLKAALDVGAGNGTIKLSRRLVAV